MSAAATVSKGEFAALMGVSPGRVSQWIAEGKIGADAMFGSGHRARIYPDIAKDQIAGRTDPGQRIGNGLGTMIAAERAAADQPADVGRQAALPLPGVDRPLTVAEQIAAAQLEKIQQQVRKGAEEERARSGQYTPTTDVKRALGRLASDLMTAIEGGLPEIANALSAKFGIPNRDALHELRAAFRQVRERAAEAHAERAATATALIEDTEPEEEADANAGEDE
jgi:hypothetical protein